MSYIVTYGKSVHNHLEINAVIKTLKKSTQMGKNVRLFEKKVANLFNKKYCLMVNSGTSALMLLAELIDLKKGDEFITPILTFPSTIAPFIKKGFIPKFVDVDPKTLQIDLDKLKNNITNKTKAIVVPNLIGNIARWDKIKKIIAKKKIILIEDSADTLGSKVVQKKTGSFSDYIITSFYGSHVINCAGNGGALMLNNKKKYIRGKILRSWGRLSSITSETNLKDRFNYKLNGIDYDKKFVFQEMGFNFEPSEIGAAFGIEQIKKLNKNIKLRQKNFKLHTDFFKKYSKYFKLPVIDKKISTAMLAYPLIIQNNSNFKRKELQLYLERNGIQTRPIFSGNILFHPGFKNVKHKSKEKKFHNADDITRNGILIGLHHGINEKKIKYIHKTFKKFLVLKNCL